MNQKIEKYTTRVPFSGCWLWTRGAIRGYGATAESGKKMYAHRVAYRDYVGEIPSGMWVLHRCDVPLCCNPNHLFIGTPKDNTRDSMSKGRHKKPPVRIYWKLTQEQKNEIVRRFRDGESASELALIFGVHKSRVHQLNRAAT